MQAPKHAVVPLVFVLALACGCNRTTANQQSTTEKTVEVPSFAIALKLSANLEQRLRSTSEGLKVLVWFSGDLLGPGMNNPPTHEVYLGSAKGFVDETKTVRFEHIQIAERDYDRLADKNFFVTINTLPAQDTPVRRVANDNLLECTDPISVRIDTLKGKTTEIHCSLWGEDNYGTVARSGL